MVSLCLSAHTSLCLSHWNRLRKVGALVTLTMLPSAHRNSLLPPLSHSPLPPSHLLCHSHLSLALPLEPPSEGCSSVTLAILPLTPRNILLVQMLARLVAGCVACYPAVIPPRAKLSRSVAFLADVMLHPFPRFRQLSCRS